MRKVFVLILVLLLTACNAPAEMIFTPTPPATEPEAATFTSVPTAAEPSPTPEPTLPPIQGADPSYQVGAFYYPWYGNPATDGEWIHWTQKRPSSPQGYRQ